MNRGGDGGGQLITCRAHSVVLNRKRTADTADWQGDNLLS